MRLKKLLGWQGFCSDGGARFAIFGSVVYKVAVVLLMVAALCFISCDDDDDDDSGSSKKKEEVKDDDTEIVAKGAPTFNPDGGFYKEAFPLEIKCDGGSGTNIYYYILKPQFKNNNDGKGDRTLVWDEEAWRAEVAKSNFTAKDGAALTPYLYKSSSKPTINSQCVVRAMAVKSDGTRTYSMTAFDFDPGTTNATSQSVTGAKSDSWGDQTMYFILTDRFNKAAGTAAVSAAKNSKGDDVAATFGSDDGYYGGNLKGIEEKLDYIKGMGFTSIFITPPTESQESNGSYHGYHGYWTSNFLAVDRHLGDLSAYQSLVSKAHEKGLRVVQDFNVNNTGDYMSVSKALSEYSGIPRGEVTLNAKSAPLTHPTQLPWALNNIADITSNEFSSRFYNYTLKANNNASGNEMEQLDDLDDFNTRNAVVQKLFRGYGRYWIDKVGIDGFRLNNAYGVQKAYFNKFVNGSETGDEGVGTYGSAKKGDKDFLVFAEAQSINETPNDSVLASYTNLNGNPLVDSVQYGSLQVALNKAIIEGKTDTLKNVLENRYKVGYRKPDRLVTFIDNHDTERWFKSCGENEALWKMAYNILFTINGIPQVYCGSEQHLQGKRDAMFAQSGAGLTASSDHFDNTSAGYKYFKALNAMRSDVSVFNNNVLTILTAGGDNGLYAHLIQKQAGLGGVGKKALVIQNSSSSDLMLNVSNDALGINEVYKAIDTVTVTTASDGACTIADSASSPYKGISSLGDDPNTLSDTINIIQQPLKDGTSAKAISIKVPAKTCGVYILKEIKSGDTLTGATITIDESTQALTADADTLTITGTSSSAADVKVIVNDDVGNPVKTQSGIVANTQFTIDAGALPNLPYGTHSIKLVQEDATTGAVSVSASKSLVVQRVYKYQTEVADPISDAKGVSNESLTLSSGDKGVIIPSYGDGTITATMDIRGVEVYTMGHNIRLGIRMTQLCHLWNPSVNSFDHTAFYVFINTSASGPDTGCAVLPNCHYTLPSTFGKWNYLYMADGWSSRMFSATGADTTHWGTVTSPIPSNNPAIDWTKVTLYKDSESGRQYEFAKMTEQWDKVWGVSPYAPLDSNTAWVDINTPPAKHNIPGIIWIDIPAASIGNPDTLTGVKILVGSYDFGDDRQPRELKAVADASEENKKWMFTTTGTPATTPMIADMTDNVITLP